MKKVLLTAAVAGVLAVSAHGQGQVQVGNNSSTLVSANGVAIPIGSGTQFQLYFGAASGSLAPVGGLVPASPTFAGRIQNTAVDVGSPGTTFFFQIFAWQG